MDGPLLDILRYPATVFIVDDLHYGQGRNMKYIIIFKTSIKRKHVSVFCDIQTHQTEASWPLQCEQHAGPVTRAAYGHFKLKDCHHIQPAPMLYYTDFLLLH